MDKKNISPTINMEPSDEPLQSYLQIFHIPWLDLRFLRISFAVWAHSVEQLLLSVIISVLHNKMKVIEEYNCF